MLYSPTVWHERVPLHAANLDKRETGIDAVYAVLDDLTAVTLLLQTQGAFADNTIEAALHEIYAYSR